jgi:hypothetical protein
MVAAWLPLAAACQRPNDELPAAELVEPEPCDCEEPCPDCICEEGAKAPAPAEPAESEGEDASPGGP